MHVVVDCDDTEIKNKIKKELEEHGIAHTTIELEGKDEKCDFEECEIKKSGHSHHHHH